MASFTAPRTRLTSATTGDWGAQSRTPSIPWGGEFIVVKDVQVESDLTLNNVENYSSSAPVKLSGYKPIAIAGVRIENADSGGANASYVLPYRYYIDDSDRNIHYALRNFRTTDDADAVIKVTFYILYIKS